MAKDSDQDVLDDGIEDDRLRLIIPLPQGYDPAPLAPVAEGGRVAALLLPPGADPAAARAFGQRFEIAVFARDDLAAARGLDGLLLTDPAGAAEARRALPPDQVLGVLCGIDRHEAMEAGEAGADWILFGRTDLDPGKAIEAAAWWTELFVLPCGVTGLIDPNHMQTLVDAKIAFALPGPFCWQAPDPIALLAALDQAVGMADPGAV
ncbi:thiamine phosphate synthase [Geminicoccus roseus]|uniref:thiamine phosphate synthase n=1 Tax=Geminicoccus roseus TaxID=404900 RepID=UPI00042A902D|nr:thiamine phosphate synthase [Geminicoccus roseus]